MMQDMGHGGDLNDRDLLHALGDLKPRHASMRSFPSRPAIATVTTQPDPIGVTNKILRAYLEDRIEEQDWVYPAAEIDKEIDARFYVCFAAGVAGLIRTARLSTGQCIRVVSILLD